MTRSLLSVVVLLLCACSDDDVYSRSRPLLRSGKVSVSSGEQAVDFAAPSQGFSLAGRWITERFRAAQVSKLDLLWVIDGSDSMAEEQGKVAAAAARFIEALGSRQVDARLAVTAMDLTEFQSGCLKSIDGQRWFDLAVNSALATDRFRRAVAVGVGGSTTEAGLVAGLVASAGDRPCNEGFLRPDAAFTVIFVSDEDDQSPMQLETARRWMLARRAQVHAVVGAADRLLAPGISGCISPDRWPAIAYADLSTEQRGSLDTIAVFGQRYRALAAATGGVSVSICEEDFAEPLAQVALAAAGVRQRYGLNVAPDPDSIAVQLDGQVVVRSVPGGDFGWWYEEEGRNVVFAQANIPEWPASIAVRYLAAP
jgi:hypothetical protein